MLGYDDCCFVCMQFKTVPFRQVYNSAHKSEDLNIDCFPENEIRNRWSNGMFFKNILRGRAEVARQAHNLEAVVFESHSRNKLR